MLMREKRRLKVASKYAKRRRSSRADPRPEDGPEERAAAQVELQQQPRDAGATRQRNRCSITGRSRGVYRKFGLARTKLRKRPIAVRSGPVEGELVRRAQ